MIDHNSYWSRRYLGKRLARRAFLGGSVSLGVGVAALSLVGCDDDDDDTAPPAATAAAQTPAPTATAAAQTPAPTATAADAPKQGGSYIWEGDGIRFVPPVVDPYLSGSGGNRLMLFIGNIGVRRNFSGSELVPELLSAWETADGIEHVTTITPGVKTHDGPLTGGRLFDTEDVALSLERMAGLLDPSGDPAGYWMADLVPGLVRAEAVDESDVRVTLSSPAAFPWGLTLPYASLLPRENSDSGGLQNADPAKLSGTGAWVLSEYRTDESFTATRNPDYFGGAPYMDEVIWRPTGDRVSQSASFIQGNGTFFNNPSKVERETILAQREGSQLFHWAGSTCAYCIFNNRSGAKFEDVRLRRAMHLATNYVANQTAFWGEGFYALGGVLNNAHAEGLPEEELLKLPGWREDKTEDLQTANELIAAAGFPQGKGLSIEYMGNTVWEAYGYNFSIRQMDDWRSAFPEIDVEGRLSADPTAHIEALTNGGFDVSHLPIGSSSPPSTDLGQYITGASNNFTGYANPELDAVIARAAAKYIPSEASEDILEAQRILLEDIPQLIDHRLHQAAIYAPTVRGFPIIPGATEPLAGNFENWDTIARHAEKLWHA